MDQSIASQNDPNVLVVPEESGLILIESPRRNGAQHSQTTWREVMTSIGSSEAAKAVVRRNTDEVQSGGNFEVFDELFADDFLDHTPQPGRTPDRALRYPRTHRSTTAAAMPALPKMDLPGGAA